jgi:hypothetical protein
MTTGVLFGIAISLEDIQPRFPSSADKEIRIGQIISSVQRYRVAGQEGVHQAQNQLAVALDALVITDQTFRIQLYR